MQIEPVGSSVDIQCMYVCMYVCMFVCIYVCIQYVVTYMCLYSFGPYRMHLTMCISFQGPWTQSRHIEEFIINACSLRESTRESQCYIMGVGP